MKKALIVATVAAFIASFEMQDIELLQSLGFEVHCATNFLKINDERKKQRLLNSGIIPHQVDFERSPFSLKNIKAYKQLKRVVKEGAFNLVHCHTPMGGLLGRMAAKKYNVKHIFYTAHGFHFFKGAPIMNWLFIYNIEKQMSKKTDVLITINNEDYNVASRKFHDKHLEKIHGVGLNIKAFSIPNINREEKRKQLGVSQDEKMLLSVGELSKDKNHLTSISAMKTLSKEGYKLFIAGEGKERKRIERKIKRCKLEKSVILLGYRNDISELLYASDAFLFPSYFEGLSVALMEAIASRKPIVCSKVRGNVDLIRTQESYFNPKSTESLIIAVDRVFSLDKDTMNRMIESNFKNLQKFDSANVKKEMLSIYKLAM